MCSSAACAVTTWRPVAAAFWAIVAATSVGIAGLYSTRSTNPCVSPARRIAPMSAVPNDAPRFWAVPWRPPASLVRDGSTDDMMTLPSCEARSPAPVPKTSRPTENPSLLSSTSMVERRMSAPRDRPPSPAWQTRLGERRAAIRGPARAATSIITDMGMRRFPVSNASRPSTIWR